jgi:hypothetical protein
MFSKLRKFLALEHACRRQFLLTHFDKEEDEEEADAKNDKNRKDFASDDEFENDEEEDIESNYDRSKEDTSKDVVRPNCCDNCTNRLMFSPNKEKCIIFIFFLMKKLFILII